ncbi:hypothetical protein N2605_13480 [Bradyrhizobium yuanmingense]|uniref:hypothetical protein n=1 Tax=Bradyrhizobium yuanmingense TaxID=108015 RepID=UPI0021A3A335|nr:hypothetical protein [Bradyrhizobium sp. CB1024]UWU87409.1 hypothetical protein N2605_13480 [Bradyrhizobium sp. CB1024]
MAKKSGSTHPAATQPSDKHIATIRAAGVEDTHIKHPELLARLAQEWTYLLRVRSRWASDTELRKSVAERAVTALASVGVTSERLRELATAERIEIEVHDWDRSDARTCVIHESACEIPWEYLLSAGTRAEGRYHSTLITRLFDNGLAQVRPHPPTGVLFVESAPGRFKDKYEFSDEERRISVAVGAPNRRNDEDYWTILRTPQTSELAKKIHSSKWEAIHVTGIDTHQAAWIVDDFYVDMKNKNKPLFDTLVDSSGRLPDGMILREGNESELPVPYGDLAKILVGPTPPRIVTLNLYYSGARIARELVKNKAHVALGFLDEIDDEVAELFFQAFYWNWFHGTDKLTLSIPDAFLKAWEAMPSDKVHGTSIVIWMGRSIFAPGAESIRKSAPGSSPAKRASSPKKRTAR